VSHVRPAEAEAGRGAQFGIERRVPIIAPWMSRGVEFSSCRLRW
jgi:hypothetical protein